LRAARRRNQQRDPGGLALDQADAGVSIARALAVAVEPPSSVMLTSMSQVPAGFSLVLFPILY